MKWFSRMTGYLKQRFTPEFTGYKDTMSFFQFNLVI